MKLEWTHAAKLALAASLVCLWLFAGAEPSYACSCVEPGPPAEELAASTVVFAGKVVAIRGFDTPASGIVYEGDLGTIELEVSAVWKGPVSETMLVTTMRDGAACGFAFIEGEEYVVYSRSDAIPPEVNLCSRTRLAANAQEDFAALGEGRTPGTGSEPRDGQPTDPAPPSAGGCSAPSRSAPVDASALGLIAAVAFLGFRKRR